MNARATTGSGGADGDPLHFNVKRRSEVHKNVAKGTDPPAGTIRRVIIRDVIARGMGSSICNGHPDSWLEDITIENFKLHISQDPRASYDKADHCLKFQQVKNLKLKDVEVFWDTPESPAWESALYLEDIKGLELDGFRGRQAKAGDAVPAVVLSRVENAVIRDCTAKEGTDTFLRFEGSPTKEIVLFGNDFRRVGRVFSLGQGVNKGVIRELVNIQ